METRWEGSTIDEGASSSGAHAAAAPAPVFQGRRWEPTLRHSPLPAHAPSESPAAASGPHSEQYQKAADPANWQKPEVIKCKQFGFEQSEPSVTSRIRVRAFPRRVRAFDPASASMRGLPSLGEAMGKATAPTRDLRSPRVRSPCCLRCRTGVIMAASMVAGVGLRQAARAGGLHITIHAGEA